MSIKSDSLKVVTSIRGKILRGSLKVGTKLPSKNKIATKLKVSYPSVTRAFLSLEHIGLLTIDGIYGTWVTSKMINSYNTITRFLDVLGKSQNHIKAAIFLQNDGIYCRKSQIILKEINNKINIFHPLTGCLKTFDKQDIYELFHNQLTLEDILKTPENEIKYKKQEQILTYLDAIIKYKKELRVEF